MRRAALAAGGHDHHHTIDGEGRVRRGRHRVAARQSVAAQRAPQRHPVPQGRHRRGVTLDGDVWIVRGLRRARHGPSAWRRFASGLHEPMTLAIRDEQIYVFDRNGIWRLARHERRRRGRRSRAVLQRLRADGRHRVSSRARCGSAPGGEFVIAKGGQEATTIGKHNGSVLRISADGRRATVLGYGFRQPNIGVNIRTGLVTASDQQGNYIPSTPLHIVARPAVLRLPERQAAARGLPGADRRSA